MHTHTKKEIDRERKRDLSKKCTGAPLPDRETCQNPRHTNTHTQSTRTKPTKSLSIHTTNTHIHRFIDEMYKWSGAEKPAKILDVGCGIGGTSRYLAGKLGTDTSVLGITLSPNQVIHTYLKTYI
jgi:2-polyprenyl-3-methyl-5-hydroxy-6-metoxy-1,4-benzoquinol methylase